VLETIRLAEILVHYVEKIVKPQRTNRAVLGWKN